MSTSKNRSRVAGGRKAARTTRDRYGRDFYREIGARGGRVTAANRGGPSLESIGRKGGTG